jgi:hypothetical protein
VNVLPDHRACSAVAGLAEAVDSGSRNFPARPLARPRQLRGSRIPLLVFINLATALSLPAQEVTVAPQPSRAAPATTMTDGANPTRRAADANRGNAPAAPALNPLEGYLSDWMRPRDRALLRGEPTVAPGSAESWRRLATTSAGPRQPAPTKPAAITANPYIDAMNAAANPSPATSTTRPSVAPVNTGAPSLATTSVAASLIEPEAPAPPPPTRYQPPPSSDAKYFPQLKRF